jgi:hypothetical protein
MLAAERPQIVYTLPVDWLPAWSSVFLLFLGRVVCRSRWNRLRCVRHAHARRPAGAVSALQRASEREWAERARRHCLVLLCVPTPSEHHRRRWSATDALRIRRARCSLLAGVASPSRRTAACTAAPDEGWSSDSSGQRGSTRWTFEYRAASACAITACIPSLLLLGPASSTRASRLLMRVRPRICCLSRVQAAAAETGEKKSSVMRQIRIEKLVINCCVGESGDRLTRAAKVSNTPAAPRTERAQHA